MKPEVTIVVSEARVPDAGRSSEALGQASSRDDSQSKGQMSVPGPRDLAWLGSQVAFVRGLKGVQNSTGVGTKKAVGAAESKGCVWGSDRNTH